MLYFFQYEIIILIVTHTLFILKFLYIKKNIDKNRYFCKIGDFSYQFY